MKARFPRVLGLLVVVVSLVLASLAISTPTTADLSPPVGSAPTTRPQAPTTLAIGGTRGVGDPYFPDYGNGGYDATKYTIDVDFDPQSQILTGTTVVTARATMPLASFYLDLALPTRRVLVNGVAASFQLEGRHDLKIIPITPLPAGKTFEVTVDYGGRPGSIAQPGIDLPWRARKDEWVIAGEPESSAWLYPANDHPSDPALLDVSVRVPAGYQAISIGRLVSADTADETDHDTWHWQTTETLPTYASFLAIGHYALRQGEADGRPYVYAVSKHFRPAEQRSLFTALGRTPSLVTELEAIAGPYPYSELGGFVPAVGLPFAGLEAATRPVYDAGSLLDADYGNELLTHELAHMWFGDRVTLLQWNDIFTNEAFASWAAWEVVARQGGRTTDAQLDDTYAQTRRSREFWRVTMTDPGVDHLFDAVYYRGPMALTALNNVLGDAAFDKLIRDWAQQPSGPHSLEDFMAEAQRRTTVDLTPFFNDWLADPAAPAKTRANGFD